MLRLNLSSKKSLRAFVWPVLMLAALPSLCAAQVAGQAQIENLDIRCGTLQPTTSVTATTAGGRVRVRVIHHKGTSEAPIFNGTVTSRDLPLLQADAALFEKLGSRMEFDWPVKSCQSYGWGLVSCLSNDQPFTINGVKIDSVSFNTGRSTERTFATTITKTKLYFWFSIDGRFRQISFDYDSLDCQVAFQNFVPKN